MNARFEDRRLPCSDCHGEFVFTAGEQLFFFDKQFKNDPKRCKPCKARRSGLAAAAAGALLPATTARPETRTECSECGIETTVPFKPTQGRPVLCRQCFQGTVPGSVARLPGQGAGAAWAGRAESAQDETAAALTGLSTNAQGAVLSPQAATLAAASMSGALPRSSIASSADLLAASAEEDRSPMPATHIAMHAYAAHRAETSVYRAQHTSVVGEPVEASQRVSRFAPGA